MIMNWKLIIYFLASASFLPIGCVELSSGTIDSKNMKKLQVTNDGGAMISALQMMNDAHNSYLGEARKNDGNADDTSNNEKTCRMSKQRPIRFVADPEDAFLSDEKRRQENHPPPPKYNEVAPLHSGTLDMIR